MVQDYWSVRKILKLLEEFYTGSLLLQPELSVYFKSQILKLKDDPLESYGFNYNHNNSDIAKVATKYLSAMTTSVPSERVLSITGEIVGKKSRL
ncbi:hypothetical protein NPIL_89831 [Nephila pilipes]|uniref:Uncharacterized protein n=1 Tax=Nephila pilipes TaxID=299642 RepID=A0A8X6TAT9_NEPPI|nr:hypothetical protein NPIL_89831 [Nephila pilipes]